MFRRESPQIRSWGNGEPIHHIREGIRQVSEQSRFNVKYGIIVNKNRLLKNDPKPQIIEVANIREHGEKAAQKLDGLTADKSQTDQNISIMHGDRHVRNSESERVTYGILP